MDLSSIKTRFLKNKSWFRRLFVNINTIEAKYVDYLQSIVDNPGKKFSPPSQDVDEFWHTHILDTEKYAGDCGSYFGRFIHHHPAGAGYCAGGCNSCSASCF
jgi:hypothetical protein